ncbi:sigma-70 family RNA polymerase sigma factor (plasmid) [Streptomyces laculatispora]|uniref:Sigma-70 family RNA polymerase sigma factor n=1 Tax=Streptomyces laculatispora TaxID=887464 RepID=A0ABY9IFI1_9ACTN|nr:sigma-70 family RNA polymerase sigma factor [Streptomyces laculatispora]WLQ45630.1 sigma-70 family RNA polymerase sigma factor [Streptomyces laculatispora]
MRNEAPALPVACKFHVFVDTYGLEGDVDSTDEQQNFTELYRQHFGAVDAYVRRRAHPDYAADVVAEVFLVAWRRLRVVPVGAELPWLYAVARKSLANTYRSDGRRLRLVEALAAQPQRDVGDHSDAIAQRQAIATVFDGLKGTDQEVLRLILWEGLTSSQAAKALGCTVPALQVRLHRARKRLRRGLGVLADDESGMSSSSAWRNGPANWGGADARN